MQQRVEVAQLKAEDDMHSVDSGVYLCPKYISEASDIEVTGHADVDTSGYKTVR